MNHSDIRKHLKKGELAVAVLETLGYSFVDNQREHPHWVAPVSPLDALKDAIEALIKEGVEKGVKAEVDAFKDDPKKGPNWHHVMGFIKGSFQVRQENIPWNHPLRGFGAIHFKGKDFVAQDIEYVKGSTYTGYVVVFNFQMRPYGAFTEQRLPLSCAAFQS